jgi:hypothetical protein
MGRALGERTVFHRDPNGRIFMSTTEKDPLWLESDTEALLEWQREQALLCPGCGHPRDESMSKEAMDAYESKAMRCHACAARDRAHKKFTSQPHDDAGLYYTIGRRSD